MIHLEQALLDAITKTFAAMSLGAVTLSPTSYQQRQPLVWGRVVASTPAGWSVRVCMARQLATRLCELATGNPGDLTCSYELLDGVGEIANTIAGRLFISLRHASAVHENVQIGLPEMGFSTGECSGKLYSFETAGSVFGVILNGIVV